jgi:hypothetical protein
MGKGWRQAMAVLVLSSVFITSCTPSQTKALLQPSQVLGMVLAEEVARLAGANKRVAIITPDSSWGPTSTVEEIFRASLNKRGVLITIAKSVNVGNPMRRGQIGLKGDDFFEILEKSADAGAIVSFAGSPLINPADETRITSKHPPVVVVATASLGNVSGVWSDPVQLAGLVDADVIHFAVIDNPEPLPQAGKTDAAHDQFNQHFRILRRTN